MTEVRITMKYLGEIAAGAERERERERVKAIHSVMNLMQIPKYVIVSNTLTMIVGSDDYYVCQKCLGRMWNKSIPQGGETAKFRTRSLANRLMHPR